MWFGGIHVERETVHRTADGRRLLVMHGDEFDGLIGAAKWLSKLGGTIYGAALRLNPVINAIRRRLGYSHWSLASFLKNKAKQSVQWLARFEHMLTEAARQQDVDGIVCGHIHRPAIEEVEGVSYYNCGDWVESCTALVEHVDGSMELVYWLSPNTRKTVRVSQPLVRTVY